jgi:hypothetical protein
MCRTIQKDRKTKVDTDSKIVQVIDVIQKLHTLKCYIFTSRFFIYIYIYDIKDVNTYSVHASVST